MKCLICEVEVNTSTSLSVHIKNIHKLTPQEYYLKYIGEEPSCPQCGKVVQFLSILKGYRKFCSIKCSAQYSELQKQETCLKRYGVRKPLQSKVFLKKSKDTLKQSYNVENPMQCDIIKKKVEQTNIRKFGAKNIKQSILFKKQLKDKYIQQILPILQKDLENLNLKLIDIFSFRDLQSCLEIVCKICNTKFETRYFYLKQGYGRCPTCYPRCGSIAETDLIHYTKSLFLETTKNNRDIINPLELDIFIPSKQIAIEYNGIYWHSEAAGKDKNYHLNKLNLCLEKGISLIQIFEDEWIMHQDIVKSRLKQILGVNDSKRIHARKCYIKLISNKIKNEFLNTYHLQGTDNSPISLGAFYTDPCSKEQLLVAVMTFSHGSLAKGVKNKDENIWELNRFCSDYNFHIPGVASKLLSYFKKNYKWKKIYSFADRRWSIGNLYKVLGFELESITKPNYWYVKGLKRIHRFSLRKRSNEPKEIPEWLLRMQEGYTRVWDCGNLKFVINS